MGKEGLGCLGELAAVSRESSVLGFWPLVQLESGASDTGGVPFFQMLLSSAPCFRPVKKPSSVVFDSFGLLCMARDGTLSLVHARSRTLITWPQEPLLSWELSAESGAQKSHARQMLRYQRG